MMEENGAYRSIHYTLYLGERNTYDTRLEIQTRTIFEEGWSEINHKLVYKNSELSEYLILVEASTILSALVGDCDTLGELMKNIHDEYILREERISNGSSSRAKSDEIMKSVLKDFLSNY